MVGTLVGALYWLAFLMRSVGLARAPALALLLAMRSRCSFRPCDPHESGVFWTSRFPRTGDTRGALWQHVSFTTRLSSTRGWTRTGFLAATIPGTLLFPPLALWAWSPHTSGSAGPPAVVANRLVLTPPET